MKINSTKQKVMNAASLLFYQKGFHGTSVRDIADKAAVNVSLISYYFKSKQGLLEYAVTHYYDSYIEMMEQTIENQSTDTELVCCKLLIHNILDFKLELFQLTAFINRELSLDSTFVREMTVTYLAKENHLLSNLFYKVINKKNQNKKNLLYMQFKGMIMAPITLKHEWNNQFFDKQDRTNFIHQYIKPIEQWLEFLQK